MGGFYQTLKTGVEFLGSFNVPLKNIQRKRPFIKPSALITVDSSGKKIRLIEAKMFHKKFFIYKNKQRKHRDDASYKPLF